MSPPFFVLYGNQCTGGKYRNNIYIFLKIIILKNAIIAESRYLNIIVSQAMCCVLYHEVPCDSHPSSEC